MPAPRSPFRTYLRRRRRHHRERGATLVISALLMVALIGFVGFAVDVGMPCNERRQEQSAVDTAVLSGAREALLNGASDQTVFDEVTRLSHENMDRPPSLTQWRQDFRDCTDPGRVAAGFTVPLSTAAGTVDCISFTPDRSELRVTLPTTELDTTFVAVLGLSSWDVSAFAEAGLAEGRGTPNIIPFALSAGSGGSGMTCLKTPPGGQAAADCQGPTAGNFGFLSLPRPTFPGNQRCNGGHGNIITSNIAMGIDHFLSVRRSNTGGATFIDPRIDDDCPSIEAGQQPNHVFVETGVIDSYLEAGLVTGSSAIPDGLGGRLTRSPAEWKTLCVRSYCIDDRALFQFFDVGIAFGGSVDYDGVVLPGHAPVICDPEHIRTTLPTTAQGYQARTVACLDAYDALGYTADLFNRDSNSNGVNDILETSRFTWLPESWTVLTGANCNGTNCDYDIQRFTPVFIQNLYYVRGQNYWVVPPAPLGDKIYGTNGIVSNNAALRGANAFTLNPDLFPQEILDEGPLAGQVDLVEIALTR